MSSYSGIIANPIGPKARSILKRGYSLLSSPPFPLQPLIIHSAEDCIVEDVDGNQYIDFTSFSCVMNLGHGQSKVVAAIKEQSESLLYHDQSSYNDPALNLAEALVKIVPAHNGGKVLYGAGESETIDAVVKLVKWHTRRSCFLSFSGACHGTTYGALSLSASGLTRSRYFHPMLGGIVYAPYPYCYRCPFNQDLAECDYWCVDFIEENILEKHLPHEEVAGVFFEPIQWIEGCITPPPDYFKRLKKLTDRLGLLLVDDEAYTGMGRTGRWFGIDNWKINPDVVCVSGALASGLPLGAVVSSKEIMDWDPGAHSSLFGGNPLACAAALKVIESLREENLIENGSRVGKYLLSRLMEFKDKYSIVGDIRGKGLMIGIEIVKDQDTRLPHPEGAKKIGLECFRRALITSKSSSSTLLLSPPLSITKDLVDRAIHLLEGSIAEVNRTKN